MRHDHRSTPPGPRARGCLLCDPLSGSAVPEGGDEAWACLVVTMQHAGGYGARGRRRGLGGWCGAPSACGRLWCPRAAAGPGRASSRRTEPKARGADGERAGRRPRARRVVGRGGPPPSGTESSRGGGPPPSGTESSWEGRAAALGHGEQLGRRAAALGHGEQLGRRAAALGHREEG